MRKLDVILIVDRSGSLKKVGAAIITALKQMITVLKTDPYLHGFEIYFTLISFASDMTKNFDFVPLKDVDPNTLDLTFTGQTNPGPALRYAVDKAYNRYYAWKDAGNSAYHPLLFFFSDGNPYPINYIDEFNDVAAKIKALGNEDKILAASAGFGREISSENLEKLTKSPSFVVRMDDETNVAKLQKFFTQIIAKTTTLHTTNSLNQISNMFRRFTQE